MPVKPSGSLGFSEIQAEFGGTAPINISEYYRGGAYVPNVAINNAIPTGGAIAVSNFYGATNIIEIRYVISAGAYVVNLNMDSAMAASLGYPIGSGVPLKFIFELQGGAVLGSTNPDVPALYITPDGMPANTQLEIIVGGGAYITGAGRNGGYGGGGRGGTAIWYNDGYSPTLSIYNYGVIQGGGDASGQGDSGGGAGYYGGTSSVTGGTGTLNEGGYGGYNNAKGSPNGNAGGGPGGGIAIHASGRIGFPVYGDIRGEIQ
jgi:hypothetical protein